MPREQLWKRIVRREALQGEKLPSGREDRDSFFELIHPHLEPLTRMVRHLIAYAEASGDLMRHEVSVEDLVDDTLLAAYRGYLKNHCDYHTRVWLAQLASEHLEAAVKASRASRQRNVQIEEDVLETPPAEEVSTLGDEILDFYQPDEDLKLEDLIADLDMLSPEQAMGLKELQSQVQTELNGLPRKWKRALVLRYVDGLTGPDLASALGVKAAEAERTLKYAGACLREKLLEAGFSTGRMA